MEQVEPQGIEHVVEIPPPVLPVPGEVAEQGAPWQGGVQGVPLQGGVQGADSGERDSLPEERKDWEGGQPGSDTGDLLAQGAWGIPAASGAALLPDPAAANSAREQDQERRRAAGEAGVRSGEFFYKPGFWLAVAVAAGAMAVFLVASNL
ncbi:hypothetical protein ABYF32_08850 [Buchananella felis]|uniref:hypothetical protein n=1 Tax=Buchananella felis TaxID=3231492 RepID=UPI00352780F8